MKRFLSLTALLLIAACSASEGGADGGGDGVESADRQGTLGTATGGGLKVGGAACEEDCAEGTFCSSAGECIASGSCLTAVDCSGGYQCVEGACEVGGECGSSEFELTSIPPNLLLILDRSCSMGVGASGKWTQAVSAVTNLTNSFGQDVRFGLELYPDGNDSSDWEMSCSLDSSLALPVPLADDGGAQTAALLKEISDDSGHRYYPGSGACQTNTFAALYFAAQLEALKDPTRGNYAMLITDGAATCVNENRWPQMGSLEQIDTLLGEMASAGLPTFVIGFGSGVDPAALASHAASAGTARDADPAYYQADSAEELEEAINSIAGSIVSCDFSLDSKPPNSEQLYVFFDDEERLEPDETNGWVLSGQTLSFRGSACDRLRNREVEDVDVVFGCPQPVTK